MPYRIEYGYRSDKDLEALPKEARASIIEAVRQLAENPRAEGTIKLKGKKDLYRVRVGNYRVIYKIEDARLLVIVVEVGDRKDVYK